MRSGSSPMSQTINHHPNRETDTVVRGLCRKECGASGDCVEREIMECTSSTRATPHLVSHDRDRIRRRAIIARLEIRCKDWSGMCPEGTIACAR